MATQAGLWAVLTLADPHYWAPVLASEVDRAAALRLSFAMNATSFGVGLLLPL